MNKWLYMLTGALGATVLALGTLALVPTARAEDPAPTAPQAAQPGYGRGRMGGPMWQGAAGTQGQVPPVAGRRAMWTIMVPVHERVHAALAAELGMTQEEFEAALAEGKTLATLAEEKQVEPEALVQVMTEARNAAIDDLVEEGTLDAETAEQLKAFHAERAGSCMTGTGFGPGAGGRGRGMRGGRGPGWQFNAPATNNG